MKVKCTGTMGQYSPSLPVRTNFINVLCRDEFQIDFNGNSGVGKALHNSS